ANDRGLVTGLLSRSTNATLPAGTRFVEFALTNRVVTGMNDASADNLAFVLTPKTDPPFAILAFGTTPDGWRVAFDSATNRVYELQRSGPLESWLPVTLPTPGSGAPMTLVDTNAPPGQAFYRVGSRRP